MELQLADAIVLSLLMSKTLKMTITNVWGIFHLEILHLFWKPIPE